MFCGQGGRLLPKATPPKHNVISIVFIIVCFVIKLLKIETVKTPHSLLLFMTSRMLKPKYNLVLSVMVRIELTPFLRITVFSSTTELHN